MNKETEEGELENAFAFGPSDWHPNGCHCRHTEPFLETSSHSMPTFHLNEFLRSSLSPAIESLVIEVMSEEEGFEPPVP